MNCLCRKQLTKTGQKNEKFLFLTFLKQNNPLGTYTIPAILNQSNPIAPQQLCLIQELLEKL
jgi:hypothetical protein